jgi:hypothetical protein
MPFDPVSAGVGLAMQVPALWNQFKVAKQQKKEGEKYFVPEDVNATVSPYEQQNLQEMRNAYNTGMMPGQAIAMQGLQNQADTMRRNASMNTTSASARMKMGGLIQGQESQSYLNLMGQFGQQKTGMLSGLSNALGRMTGEENKVFADKRYVHERENAAKQALLQSAMQNKQMGFNTISNIGAMIGTGAFGDMGDMMKGKPKGLPSDIVDRNPVETAQGNWTRPTFWNGGQQPFTGVQPGMGNRPNTSGFNFGGVRPINPYQNFFQIPPIN